MNWNVLKSNFNTVIVVVMDDGNNNNNNNYVYLNNVNLLSDIAPRPKETV